MRFTSLSRILNFPYSLWNSWLSMNLSNFVIFSSLNQGSVRTLINHRERPKTRLYNIVIVAKDEPEVNYTLTEKDSNDMNKTSQATLQLAIQVTHNQNWDGNLTQISDQSILVQNIFSFIFFYKWPLQHIICLTYTCYNCHALKFTRRIWNTFRTAKIVSKYKCRDTKDNSVSIIKSGKINLSHWQKLSK